MSDLVSKAHIYCVSKHAFQKRKYCGSPYWIHPLRVSGMVLEVPYLAGHHIYNREGGTYQAVTHDGLVAIALLHDVIEDTDTSGYDIKKLFGDIVADGVLGLTNTSKFDAPNANRAERKRIDREKIAKQPAWIRLIKFCDRYDNLADTFDYVANWNAKQFLPDSGFFYKYLKESHQLLEVLNMVELEQIYGTEFFEKYNMNMLMTSLKDELDLLTVKVENA